MKHHGEEKHPRKLDFHKMIPNMITLSALAAGMTSIKFAIAERWEAAVLAIVAAAFLDAIDGAAARLLKAQSKIGAELDSFSDFICFGVAPALVVYLWSMQAAGKWGWPVALVFTMAVTLRLARFNVACEETTLNNPLCKYFVGVPSPTGAGLCLLPMIVSFQAEGTMMGFVRDPQLTTVWALVVAGMMVSHIPTFSSKQIRVPYRMRFLVLAAFGIFITGLINEPWPTLTLMGVAYLLLLPFGVRHYNRKARALQAGHKDPDDLDTDD